MRIKHKHGYGVQWLYSYDIEWFNAYQDDPSCWTSKEADAMQMTELQAKKMMRYIGIFQEAEIVA